MLSVFFLVILIWTEDERDAGRSVSETAGIQ